jgi:hypothetical protein
MWAKDVGGNRRIENTHIGKLYDLYLSPSINRVKTSSMMRQKA